MSSACVSLGFLFLCCAATAQQFVISTVAGGVPSPRMPIADPWNNAVRLLRIATPQEQLRHDKGGKMFGARFSNVSFALSLLVAGGAALAQQYVISTYAGGAPLPALRGNANFPDAGGNVRGGTRRAHDGDGISDQQRV